MTTRRPKRLATAAVGVAMLLAGSVSAGSASAATPYCGITWGSLPKQTSSAGSGVPAAIAGVRTGRHGCYDRLVVDIEGRGGSHWVEYVDYVKMDGSGFVVPLEGGAKLQIVTARSELDYRPTYSPANRAWLADVTGYRTFRQVAFGGSFEANTTLGLGVRARLPFRVFVLDGPGSGSRLVVDVAHRW